ncbi:hypothetical protein Taro_025189 [Colocasia esculenta]|uniref:Uncharacterized protein n=1 Tax=Colocasia esculenta TaxID=4460 RepID=A0A843V8T9_COLES|nr:hypothetical protein [Colocasia esculenta]
MGIRSLHRAPIRSGVSSARPGADAFMFTHFCLGSVDTRSGQVDTSPRFQKTQFPDWDSRSTLAQGRSTLDPVSSRPVLQKWDSRSTLIQGRSTHSGNSVT